MVTKQKVEKEIKEEIEDLKSPKGYLYAGLPLFKGLFGRDSLIAAWQLLDFDSKIAKDTLIELSKVQGKAINEVSGEEPGKICHEYYDDDTSDEWFNETKGEIGWLKKGQPVYFSVDSTLLYIVLFYKYFEKKNDYQLLETLWPNIKLALDWVFDFGMYNGFVRYLAAEDGLKCQSWKDGMGAPGEKMKGEIAVVEVQGYAYLALNYGRELAKIMADQGLAEKCDKEAIDLKERFNQEFWNESQKFFYFAIDGDGKKYDLLTSNPGHLLFTGICDDKNELIVARLFAEDFWTPYGIRTLSLLDENLDLNDYQLGAVWPYDNWMIAQGLKKKGFEKEYAKVAEAIMAARAKLGILPEYYGVDKENNIYLEGLYQEPCCPQAWSICALYNFIYEKEKNKSVV